LLDYENNDYPETQLSIWENKKTKSWAQLKKKSKSIKTVNEHTMYIVHASISQFNCARDNYIQCVWKM